MCKVRGGGGRRREDERRARSPHPESLSDVRLTDHVGMQPSQRKPFSDVPEAESQCSLAATVAESSGSPAPGIDFAQSGHSANVRKMYKWLSLLKSIMRLYSPLSPFARIPFTSLPADSFLFFPRLSSVYCMSWSFWTRAGH